MRTYRRVRRAEESPIRGHGDTRHRDLLFGDELVCAGILGQVPEPDAAAAVAADDLALVRVDHNIIYGRAVVVAPLDGAAPRLPDLDGAILGACHHPFSLAVECDSCDIAGVALKGEQRGGVRGADVEKLDGVVASGGEVALVRGDA